MSELSEAFDEVQDAADECHGAALTVTLDGTAYPALIEEVTHEEIEVAGGQGQAGGFRCHIAISDLPTKPDQLDTITARGLSVFVLSVVNTNGVAWTIVAGDPAIE